MKPNLIDLAALPARVSNASAHVGHTGVNNSVAESFRSKEAVLPQRPSESIHLGLAAAPLPGRVLYDLNLAFETVDPGRDLSRLNRGDEPVPAHRVDAFFKVVEYQCNGADVG